MGNWREKDKIRNRRELREVIAQEESSADREKARQLAMDRRKAEIAERIRLEQEIHQRQLAQAERLKRAQVLRDAIDVIRTAPMTPAEWNEFCEALAYNATLPPAAELDSDSRSA